MKKLCCVFWKIEAHINKYGRWHRITHLSCFEAHVSSVAVGYGTGWVWRTWHRPSYSLSPWAFCLNLPNAGITGLHLPSWLSEWLSSCLKSLGWGVVPSWSIYLLCTGPELCILWNSEMEESTGVCATEAKQNKDSDSGEEQHCSFSLFPVVFVCPVPTCILPP